MFQLSICIPTYKRPAETRRLLESLVPQLVQEVEVLVRDDSPDEETAAVVGEFQKRFPIRYEHGVKEGLDAAIIALTQAASGEFVWWLGNEDVREDAVRAVLEVIRACPRVSFIWVNHALMGHEPAISLGGSRLFRDRNEPLEIIVGGLGFISATIFRRSLALTGVEQSKRWLRSAFVNLYLVLHVLSQSEEAYFLDGLYISSYPNTPEEVNDDGFEVFGVNLYRIVHEFDGKFQWRSIRIMLTRNFRYVWRGVIVRWVTGYESPRGKRWRMFKLYWTYPEMWLAIIPLLLPLSVNRALYGLYRKFFQHQKFLPVWRRSHR